jgi:hypothetical protein
MKEATVAILKKIFFNPVLEGFDCPRATRSWGQRRLKETSPFQLPSRVKSKKQNGIPIPTNSRP